MSVRLEVSTEIAAPVDLVWNVLADWEGQSRWIPLTTVRVLTAHREGLGVRAAALSGFWLGPLPIGLLDRFIVTGWSPPNGHHAELEILHLGPYFTGEGVFTLRGHAGGTTVECTELFTVPGWRLGEGPGDAGAADPAGRLRPEPAGPRRSRRSHMSGGAVAGPDGLLRCPWALSAPEYLDYHDHEWGRPVRTVHGLYERMTLEAFQSGLSWITILRKRENFRKAFAGFDPEQVARFDDTDVERLMADAGIVRNRAKIEAAINNARVVTELGEDFAAADPPSSGRPIGRDRTPRTGGRPHRSRVAMAKELKRRGIRFFGPTTAYALMQAVGLVDDHLADCFVRAAEQPPAGPET